MIHSIHLVSLHVRIPRSPHHSPFLTKTSAQCADNIHIPTHTLPLPSFSSFLNLPTYPRTNHPLLHQYTLILSPTCTTTTTSTHFTLPTLSSLPQFQNLSPQKKHVLHTDITPYLKRGGKTTMDLQTAQPIVLDVGTGSLKAGFAGEEKPRAVIPTL